MSFEIGASGTAENVTLRLVQLEAEVSHWIDWNNWQCDQQWSIIGVEIPERLGSALDWSKAAGMVMDLH